MCCFRLHFSDFNVLFLKQNLLLVTFEKNNILCKMKENNNLSRGKIPAPPWISKWSVPKVILFFSFACVEMPEPDIWFNQRMKHNLCYKVQSI